MMAGGLGRLALFLALVLTGGVGAFACSGFSSEEAVGADASPEDGMTDTGVSDAAIADAAVFSCTHVDAFRCTDFEETDPLLPWSGAMLTNDNRFSPEPSNDVYASPSHSAYAQTAMIAKSANYAGVVLPAGTTHWRLTAAVYIASTLPAFRDAGEAGVDEVGTELVRLEFTTPDAGVLTLRGLVRKDPTGEMLGVRLKTEPKSIDSSTFAIPLNTWVRLQFDVYLGDIGSASWSIGEASASGPDGRLKGVSGMKLFWGAFTGIPVPLEKTEVYYDDLTLEALP